MVAHDLRSPLSSILMRSELLRRRGGESEGSAEAIRRAALRMNRLIEDMVDVARVEAGALSIKRAAVATRGLLDEVLEMQHDAASQGGLALRLDAGEQLPDAFGDRDRLVQVFDNLIGNAIKFTPQGGTIVIGAAPKRRHVLFWVRDSGPGIAPDQMTHVFDRFWQAKKTDRRGAGLGLPIVKGIIEAHGGRIRVDSQPGHGTTFYFTVPTAPFAETQVQRSP